MRDFDPTYSPNDASHPRNRPAGWEPSAWEPTLTEAAAMVAAVRAVLGPKPQASSRAASRRRGRPQVGRQLSLAEKQRVFAEYERVRDAHRARLQDASPRMLAALTHVPPGKACLYW